MDTKLLYEKIECLGNDMELIEKKIKQVIEKDRLHSNKEIANFTELLMKKRELQFTINQFYMFIGSIKQ